MTPHTWIEDEGASLVTVHAACRYVFRREMRDGSLSKQAWEVKEEYVFIIYVSEEGDQVVRVVEMLDTDASIDMVRSGNEC
jgi:hypothetical protein